MPRKATMTIHLHANCDEVVVDGKVFDRSVMTKNQRATFGALVVRAFTEGRFAR